MSDPMRKLIKVALTGDSGALRELLEVIRPPVQMAAADVLRRRLPGSAWSRARHEVEDLTQEVLYALFDSGGKRLLAWDPALGLSLPGYVKVIARNKVRSFLRNPQNVVALRQESHDEVLDLPLSDAGPAVRVEEKQIVDAVLVEMDREMSADAGLIFRMLFVEALDVEKVCARTGMTPNAVHVRRSRFLRQAGEVARRILGDASSVG